MRVLGGAFGLFAVAAFVAALLLEGPKSAPPAAQAAAPAAAPAR